MAEQRRDETSGLRYKRPLAPPGAMSLSRVKSQDTYFTVLKIGDQQYVLGAEIAKSYDKHPKDVYGKFEKNGRTVIYNATPEQVAFLKSKKAINGNVQRSTLIPYNLVFRNNNDIIAYDEVKQGTGQDSTDNRAKLFYDDEDSDFSFFSDSSEDDNDNKHPINHRSRLSKTNEESATSLTKRPRTADVTTASKSASSITSSPSPSISTAAAASPSSSSLPASKRPKSSISLFNSSSLDLKSDRVKPSSTPPTCSTPPTTKSNSGANVGTKPTPKHSTKGRPSSVQAPARPPLSSAKAPSKATSISQVASQKQPPPPPPQPQAKQPKATQTSSDWLPTAGAILRQSPFDLVASHMADSFVIGNHSYRTLVSHVRYQFARETIASLPVDFELHGWTERIEIEINSKLRLDMSGYGSDIPSVLTLDSEILLKVSSPLWRAIKNNQDVKTFDEKHPGWILKSAMEKQIRAVPNVSMDLLNEKTRAEFRRFSSDIVTQVYRLLPVGVPVGDREMLKEMVRERFSDLPEQIEEL
eukprot:TRINITY_DN1950_c0_g1_i1.p1 TRINITY_DN1950_c0_g1~~TRINITY_DN1950_c0_g1_i1.p1  ORF type:complete len:528 (+),score=86.70 TRINITY_DN1950_c0_g1_i1:147-1730(+)